MNANDQKHVVVIGAGLAGLAASYDLAQAGFRVTVIDQEPRPGGLARSFDLEGYPLERFYHFICRKDQDLFQFLAELGLSGKLSWKQTRTAFFHNDRMYSFGTPFDLIGFSAVPWMQRIRFGFHVFHSRYRSMWKWLDQIPAKPWLIESIGPQAYDVIWHPLLKVKFGEYHEQISAAWVWHRIWRVATSRKRLWERESFGYLENGSATLIEHLVGRLEQNPLVRFRCNTQVTAIERDNGRVAAVTTADARIPCDAVISTTALPVLNQFIQGDHKDGDRQGEIKYIGVVCALYSLKTNFSRNFWTNINDPRISFNGIIEQTNLNMNLRSRGLNLIYIPYYLPTSDPRYSRSDDDLFSEYDRMLNIVNPKFDQDWVKERFIFRDPYAQAICTTGFSNRVPPIRSSIGGLFVTDSSQFYPEDRTISAAIRQGRKAASLLIEDCQ